jgi:hypothetical protein
MYELTLKSAAQFIQETANEKTTAMKESAAAAPLAPVGD